jgi:PPK2 family polyphosphate:nucleotide phosphotransferase
MKTVFAKRGAKVRLDEISAEPPKGASKERAREHLAALGEEMFELQDAMWGAKVNGVMVVLQGRDSAGKDGAIKNVAGFLNPRGLNVVSFGVPTLEERQHDFLWRVHRHAPRLGEFAIFNRSHYEDVLVARVRKFAPAAAIEQRYDQINAFEKHLVENGTTVLKFMLHISKEEQRKRLQERLDDPAKHWKFNPGDLEDRELWDDFQRAYEIALERCSTAHAPWRVVPADKKWRRNAIIASIVRGTLEEMDPQYPKTDWKPEDFEIV